VIAYVDRDDLARAVAHVAQVAPRNGASPILSHALIVAQLGSLRITATDTEAAVIVTVPAQVEATGEATVEAAALLAGLKASPEITVQLVSADRKGRFTIASGKMKAALPSLEAADYPPIPAWEATQEGAVTEGSEVRAAIERMGHAVSTDDARYGMNGAHLEVVQRDNGRAIRLVATDGHRLAWSEFPIASALGESGRSAIEAPRRALVPRKALAVLRKSLPDGPCDLEIGEGAIRFAAGSRVFWFRLVDGEFPEYRAVLPKDGTAATRVSCSASALSAALRRLDLVSEGGRATAAKITRPAISLRLDHVERGTVTDEVTCEASAGVEIGLNHRYVLDALGGIPGDDVEIRITHPLAPIALSAPGDDRTVQIVMPMRLDA